MWDEKDASGSTVLMAAVQSCNNEVLDLILEQEEQVCRYNGNNKLISRQASLYIISSARRPTERFIHARALGTCDHAVRSSPYRRFQVGSMWHETDASGSTVLMAAVESGSEEVLDLILPQEEVR